MKITKDTLKQLIREELSVVAEQQSPEDIERQREITADEIHKQKYGTTADRAKTVTEQFSLMRTQVDLLTDIKDLLQQILQKP